ncbi:MAG: hypothetical protein JEZ02_13735 [Desulfatibacillum sp.]|nr:hypothetical protein [Desulfatibacillum sp.]
MDFARKFGIRRTSPGLAANHLLRGMGVALCLLVCLLAQACSHHAPLKEGIPSTLYHASSSVEGDMGRLAPVFLAHGADKDHNRIGTPKAYVKENGKAAVYVDFQKPSFFILKTSFSTEKDDYTNLVYRVHFSKIPFSLIPFTLTAGKNAGLLVVVTLNSQKQPVLVTTVHTCGCYLSIIPTTNLPRDCLPAGWKETPQNVYGEVHPPILDFSPEKGQRLLIELRPEIHRAMDVRVVGDSFFADWNQAKEEAPLIPAQALEALDADGLGPVSFFYDSGLKTGFVKGSVKTWETLLMSWMALDLFVGTDKAYSPVADKANPFYTSLKPWNRQQSNMWRFKNFLYFWGFNL